MADRIEKEQLDHAAVGTAVGTVGPALLGIGRSTRQKGWEVYDIGAVPEVWKGPLRVIAMRVPWSYCMVVQTGVLKEDPVPVVDTPSLEVED